MRHKQALSPFSSSKAPARKAVDKPSYLVTITFETVASRFKSLEA